jgi:glycosyltransferase involved in cell wall biosynthesis
MSGNQVTSSMYNKRLSICIATYNRARYIGETLDSIIPQLGKDVELVIVDGASTDNTAEVLSQYLAGNTLIRYYQETENSGVDQDFDKAVHYARGEYCWLMSDDDLLKPGAVKQVLNAFEKRHDLIVVNAEVRNTDLSVSLEERRLPYHKDQYYNAYNKEQFFSETLKYLSFIGCVVIRRELWLARNRLPYYGSLFIHVGVIFQHPPLNSIRVIADPLIIIRYGNAMWSMRSFEIWTFKWPKLVWSFTDYSEHAKRSVCVRKPWNRIDYLFYRRATNAYTIETYNAFIADKSNPFLRAFAKLVAIFPSTLANIIVVIFVAGFRRDRTLHLYDLLHNRNTSKLSSLFARSRGVKI